ncbi:hypothetical protein TREAZ_1977 [Leadbettera azotonutricia ZAS-9]|uniref:Uncharacterized protein n=1 Tax=Leadbettera azotonutricia (strain ATCC BAA-888 / DSM 13862 / ZAS-9) TaxID=545695 RepID=F5YAM8_LEAAZ|nr:hypothetical protein TREAZ_1977 [Leadbettera azotonutricia ZAS-9]
MTLLPLPTASSSPSAPAVASGTPTLGWGGFGAGYWRDEWDKYEQKIIYFNAPKNVSKILCKVK